MSEQQQLIEEIMMTPSNTKLTAEFVEVNCIENAGACHAGCSGNCHP